MADSITIYGFTGINNRLPADRIRTLPGEDGRVDLSAAVNVNIEESGKMDRRDGFALSAAFPGAHSGVAHNGRCFCVKGGVMHGFVPGVWTFAPLLNVGNDERMAYTKGAGRLFFTNGAVIGEVVDGTPRLFGSTTVPFKAPLPAGQAIGHHKARLYVAKGDIVWISDAKPLSRIDRRYGAKPFPNKVMMIAPSVDGIYIGTERAVYFGPGGNPLKMPFTKVSDYGALAIPPEYVDASGISGLQVQGVFPVFATTDGVYIGLPQGQAMKLSRDYVMGSGTTGAATIRTINGQDKYIAVYR